MSRILRLSEELCLGEIAMMMFRQDIQGLRPVWIQVQSITGVKKRRFFPIQVYVQRKKQEEIEKVWADKITGTIYGRDGKCFSSTQLRLLSPPLWQPASSEVLNS